MAKRGHFEANFMGFREIMNGPAGIDACERAAAELSASATAQSGIDYGIDSMRGLNRIHTRVSTQTDKDRFRERHYGALATACSAMGGQAEGAGYRTLKSRVGAVRRSTHKGWKAPGYRKVRR